jgi:hypothetical protein
MAITNLNNVHLSATEMNAVKDALIVLENALAKINVTLTSEDRQRYGSINEDNKLLVNKVNDYRQNQPNLSTTQVDWEEFERDFTSRLNMEYITSRLEILGNKIQNAKILHDYDNYQASLVDYGFTNFMAGTGAEGFETKMNDLKQFFVKTSPKDKPAKPE